MEKRSKNNNIEQMKKRARAKKKVRGDEYSIKKKRNIIGAAILLLQLIMSVVFIGYVDELDALPMKYFSVVFLVLMVFFIVTALMQLPRGTHIVGKVFGVIVCLVLSLGVYYLHATVKTMAEIDKQGSVSVNDFTIVVRKDSDIDSLLDIAGKDIGIMHAVDNTVRDEALSKLEKAVGGKVTPVEYNNIIDLVKALQQGDVDVIMYKSSYKGLILESYVDYESITTVLYTLSIEKEIIIDKEPEKVEVTSKPFVVYISGIDTEGKVAESGRSDVNILVFVNPLTHKILMVSTPRDYYIEMPGFTPEGMGDKLTHAGNEGIEASMAALENLYGIDIDYYAKVNFSSFKTVVDVLGEVTVYSDYDFTASKTDYKYTKGYNKISNSDKALAFVRERYAFPTGDVQRGKNQMAMINAIIDKILSPAILTNYVDLLEATSSVVLTNMPTSKLTELVKMQLDENCEWSIEKKWATGTYGWRVCYQASGLGELSVVIPDEAAVDQLSMDIAAFMKEK